MRERYAIAATALALIGCNPQIEPRVEPAVPVVSAATLSIAPESPMTGYSRRRFGTAWKDTDGNGCDQRYDVLVRDAGSAATNQPPSGPPHAPCKVIAISLIDPYSEKTLRSTADIEIDHVIPLAAAWRAGASRWTDVERERFATDRDNLLAVDGRLNNAKGDRTPDVWLPPAKSAHCRYGQIYTAVSARYALTVTPAVSATLDTLLRSCSTERK